MTGYAAAAADSPRGRLSLELRSVNARFLDLQFRQGFLGEDDAVLKTLALAAGELDEAGYAAWLAENTTEPTR